MEHRNLVKMSTNVELLNLEKSSHRYDLIT